MKRRMLILRLLTFFVSAFGCGLFADALAQRTTILPVAPAQTVESTRIDALKDSLATITSQVSRDTDRIDRLGQEVATIKGVGLGLMAVLGFLQAMQIFVQFKRGRTET